MTSGLERIEYNRASHCLDFGGRVLDFCLVTRLVDMIGYDDKRRKNAYHSAGLL